MVKGETFGPIQSRRLKLSLGVDVLPSCKKCTFNCVYCEIGPSEIQKNQLVSPHFRLKNPPSPSFRQELRSKLAYLPNLNSITFGYNGEPTLNENIIDFLNIAKEVREEIKWPQDPPKLTLFTNSTTLIFPEIRERVKQFELVLAKLDSATEVDFKRTNCPHHEVANINATIDALAQTKKEMPKEHKFAVQCLIYRSYRNDFVSNDNAENVEKLARAIKKIKPDMVQVYSIARVPAQPFVFAIDEEKKKEIVKKMREILNNDAIEINYY